MKPIAIMLWRLLATPEVKRCDLSKADHSREIRQRALPVNRLVIPPLLGKRGTRSRGGLLKSN